MEPTPPSVPPSAPPEPAPSRSRVAAVIVVTLGVLLIARGLVRSLDVAPALAGVALILGRGHAKRLLFALVALGLAAALVEVPSRLVEASRARDGQPARVPKAASLPNPLVPDEVLHHRWRPSLEQLDDWRDPPYVLFTNRQGWVERKDVEERKAAGVFRVFYLGDSNVQGVVEEDRKLVRLVERGLRKDYQGSNVAIEAINAGTSSYSTILYYLQLENEVLRYAPDLVVINLDMTDVANDWEYRQVAVFNSRGDPVAVRPGGSGDRVLTPTGTVTLGPLTRAKDWLLATSAFCRLVSTRTPLAPLLAPPPRPQPANWLAQEWSADVVASVRESMRYLGLCAELCRRHRVRLALTGVPHYPQFGGGWSARPHRALAEAAAAHGIPYLDSFEALKPKIQGTTQGSFYFDGDPTHFSIAGNQLWADAQLAFLRERAGELLPPR